jgi:hypothetical protein
MNPEQVYMEFRDEALARQVTASEYITFVAMPFSERYSYRSREIFEKVIGAAVKRANDLGKTGRRFAPPRRADDEPGVAGDVPDEITARILESHMFLADLTFENTGVLVEVGVAMAFKPSSQIVLITQDPLDRLHFDIRNNRVIQYNAGDAVEKIAEALVTGVAAFESDIRRFIESLTRTLTPDAILCLNFYGRMCRDNPKEKPSLHEGVAGLLFKGEDGLQRFRDATRELLQKRLLWTDYKVGAIKGGDAFGMHTTELGWVFIETMWSNLKRGT